MHTEYWSRSIEKPLGKSVENSLDSEVIEETGAVVIVALKASVVEEASMLVSLVSCGIETELTLLEISLAFSLLGEGNDVVVAVKD